MFAISPAYHAAASLKPVIASKQPAGLSAITDCYNTEL